MEKKRHKRKCKESEEKQQEEEIEKILNIKDGTEIWNYIRKERRKRVKTDEWKQHFINLLEGTERSREEERRIKVEGEETEEIKKKDIEEPIRKLRKKKRLRKIMNAIWEIEVAGGLEGRHNMPNIQERRESKSKQLQGSIVSVHSV